MVRLVAIAAVIGLLLAPSPVARATPPPPPHWAPLLTAARASAVVVRVDGRGGGSFESGTGFAVADGVVATAAHLTDGAVLLVTRCDGSEVEPAEVLRSPSVDLALLTIDAPPMFTAPLADADPAPGAALVLPGFPAGGPLVLAHGAVAGYYDDGGLVMEVTPAPVGGQSGSPLLDDRGRV